MTSPDLVRYVRQQTHDGIAASDLRVSLLEAGWSELDIENALHDVAAGMQPVSAGASLHEDLAQVRGMVAHLSTRVRALEARLAGAAAAPALGAQQQLAGADLRPEHEISAPHESGAAKVLWVLFVLAASVCIGWVVAQLDSAPEPWVWAVVGLDLLVLILLARWLMKKGKAWGAASLTAVAAVEAAMFTLAAALVWNLIGTAVAASLGILIIVFAMVMGKWIDRYAR